MCVQTRYPICKYNIFSNESERWVCKNNKFAFKKYPCINNKECFEEYKYDTTNK